MNLKNLLFIGLVCSARSAFGQQFDTTYGKPLIVLTEFSPWLTVINSDMPSFALYEKGQVVYQTVENEQLNIYEVTLSKKELQKMIQSLRIKDEVYKLEKYILASDWSDQTTTDLYLNIAVPKTISVYGNLEQKEVRKRTPKAFLRVYDEIKRYKNPNAHKILVSSGFFFPNLK
ncbi:MAG: hypothetical protein WCR52_01175 [Bacteroidota bacterium]